jgi:hypothetical protein
LSFFTLLPVWWGWSGTADTVIERTRKGWNGMEWGRMGWNGMEWNGMLICPSYPQGFAKNAR